MQCEWLSGPFTLLLLLLLLLLVVMLLQITVRLLA
jgi:hypothetical protein